MKKLLLILPIIALLAASCASSKQTYSQAPINANTNPAPALATTPASDWKTYSNKQYGFEIKFPSDWQESDATKEADVPTEFAIRIIKPHNPSKTGPGLQILIAKGAADTNTKTALGNAVANMIPGDDGSGYGRISYTIQKGQNYFIIGTDFSNNDAELINQILATFKIN